MPSEFFQIDSTFPTPQPGESLEQRVQKLTNYAYMLVEQLRYTLYNLDLQKNVNAASLNKFTEPIIVAISDLDGNLTQVQVEAGRISSRVSNLAGEFSTVQQTVDGLEIQTEDGVSYITGDKIKSGTIEGVELRSVYYDDTYVHVYDGAVMLGEDYVEGGELRYEDNNVILRTISTAGLKLISNQSMSIDAAELRSIYIGTSNEDQTIIIGDSVNETSTVELYGDIYVNGQSLADYIADQVGGTA